MAQSIVRDYQGRPITVLGVLTGSLMVVADLVRQLDMPLRIAFVQASSYRGASTSPSELLLGELATLEIRGRDVLVVDDIFDTGHTLATIVDRVWAQRPSSVRTAVLLRKRDRRQIEMRLDYVGFEIPNEFVVGFGLDYQDAFRHLPYVAALEPSDQTTT